ncbi:unnamed protein product [Rangifer tarandus platyrhynchus]|uniref:Uncharacterized protein n=2 Tax=Rangifer tarandus platyrhynchus TaxID=3082113 RepID=A0ABN8ZLE7_RANTA|nr:unnamed protein product [Rangifer tarandus platyrhynchus]CAI9708337.1 unnamed protein product [Rangifer tarandus platyrhynchus]
MAEVNRSTFGCLCWVLSGKRVPDQEEAPRAPALRATGVPFVPRSVRPFCVYQPFVKTPPKTVTETADSNKHKINTERTFPVGKLEGRTPTAQRAYGLKEPGRRPRVKRALVSTPRVPHGDQSRVQKAQRLAVCRGEQTTGTHQCGRAGGSTSAIALLLLHREKRPTAQIATEPQTRPSWVTPGLTFRTGSISGTPTATATVAEERRGGTERQSAVQAGGLRREAAGWVRKPSFLRSVVRLLQFLPARKP